MPNDLPTDRLPTMAETRAMHEQAVRARKKKRLQKTLVTIAHRLSTITGADQIIVMDAGRIVAQGRHGDLLASCPLYARMWADHGNAAPDTSEEA